jgi:hypothetical protein
VVDEELLAVEALERHTARDVLQHVVREHGHHPLDARDGRRDERLVHAADREEAGPACRKCRILNFGAA